MWKTYQDNARGLKNIKIAVLSLVALVVLLVLGQVSSLIGAFNLPFTKGLAGEKSRVWDGKTSYNLVYASEITGQGSKKQVAQISLINFNPKDKKVTVLHVAENIYSDLPKAYGSWRVESIYPLGEMEQEKKGALLLKLSMSKILGMPVDGVFISSSDHGDAARVFTSYTKNPVNFLSLIKNAKTDLTPWEFLRLLSFSMGVRSDKVVSLDLAQSSITESKLLPDSSRVLGVDYVNLDSFIRENLIDSLVYEENGTVAVFNATDKPGLAQQVARLVTNMGATVVFVANTEQKLATSLVVLKDDQEFDSPVTFERLSSIFAPQCINQSCSLEDVRVKNSRAQINIILGEDYYKYWFER